MSKVFEYALKVPEIIKGFRQEKLSTLRPLSEFFDHQRISRPADLNEATQRITYNTRHFSGNYLIIILLLTVYGLLTSPLLLVAVAFLVGGFMLINKFAPEPTTQVGTYTITQRGLYTTLFCIGLPMLWWASPVALIFWLMGSSAVIVLGHASFIEPPVSSEYSGVETV